MRHVCCTASLLCLLAAGTAQAGPCAYPGESSALQARVLQTELMVAALTCNQKDKYNAFVRKFNDELTGLGGNLKAYFVRTRGGRANRDLNELVTNLANEASQRSLRHQTNFCSESIQLFDALLKMEPKGLATFAASRPHADSHGIESCQLSAKKVATPGS